MWCFIVILSRFQVFGLTLTYSLIGVRLPATLNRFDKSSWTCMNESVVVRVLSFDYFKIFKALGQYFTNGGLITFVI